MAFHSGKEEMHPVSLGARLIAAGAITVGLAGSAVAQERPQCEPWTSYNGVPLVHLSGTRSYAYRIDSMAIDADGVPNAYHPQDRGLDSLANAGYPNGDWPSVLVTDPDDSSRPYVQPSGEFAGYFLAM